MLTFMLLVYEVAQYSIKNVNNTITRLSIIQFIIPPAIVQDDIEQLCQPIFTGW